MPTRVPTHKATVPGAQPADRHRQYDRTQRNPESKVFYNSARWRGCRLSKLRQDPLCEHCKAKGLIVAATLVHHKIEVKDSVDDRLDLDNLMSLCESCHSRLHALKMNSGS